MVGCMFQIETQALSSSLRTLGCRSASALAFVFAPGVYRMPLDVKCQDLLICSSSSMKRSKFRHSCNRVVMINYLHPRLGMLPSTAAHSNALRFFHRPWDKLGEGLCTLFSARTPEFYFDCGGVYFTMISSPFECVRISFRRIPSSNSLRSLRRFSDRRVRWQVWRALVQEPDLPRTWKGLLCQHGSRSKA